MQYVQHMKHKNLILFILLYVVVERFFNGLVDINALLYSYHAEFVHVVVERIDAGSLLSVILLRSPPYVLLFVAWHTCSACNDKHTECWLSFYSFIDKRDAVDDQ